MKGMFRKREQQVQRPCGGRSQHGQSKQSEGRMLAMQLETETGVGSCMF